jgi:aryl-alcohol dehydrogenase-like predicted oxidoreductase
VDRTGAAPRAVRHRAASLLDPRARHRSRRPAHLRPVRRRRNPYSPLAAGWLSGRWRKDTGQQSSSRASRLPERFDLANPYNQRKLDAVEELAQLAEQAGLTLIQLTLAFAKSHPARIDEIVPPGTTINPADNSFNNPALEHRRRRRST